MPAAPPVAHATRGYLVTFAALAVLTAAEIGVVYVPGIGRAALIAGLILLGVAKAALVLLIFMHLRDETRGVRWGVIAPCVFPVIYALALIAEAAWRSTP